MHGRGVVSERTSRNMGKRRSGMVKMLMKMASSAMLMFAVVSCLSELPGTDSREPSGKKTVYQASLPGAESRTVLEGQESYWVEGDMITIHNGEREYDFSAQASDKTKSAEFVYYGDDFSDEKGIIAVYPASDSYEFDLEHRTVRAEIPDIQYAVAGSYDPSAPLAVAVSDTRKLLFRNAAALIQVTLGVDDVRGIIFSGNDGEPVAGPVIVSMSDDNVIMDVAADDESCTEVGLYAKDGTYLKKSAVYYIAVLPGVFEKGFSLELDIDGERRKVRTLLKKYTVRSNRILDMGAIEDTGWDESLTDSIDDVPVDDDGDGWAVLARPEEFAALLMHGGKAGSSYRIAADLDMKLMSETVSAKITDDVLFHDISVDGAGHVISNLRLPYARGVFSRVSDFYAYDLEFSAVSIGEASPYSNTAGTGVLIGEAFGTLVLDNVDIYDSKVIAACKTGGLVGAIYEGNASLDGCSVSGSDVSTVWIESVSGQCGGFIGYIGRTDEGPTADRSLSVEAVISDCKVDDTSVKTHISRVERPAGIFVGAVNGYDNREKVSINSCRSSASLTVTGGLTDFKSRFCNACKAEFVSSLTEENLIGGSAYCRAEIRFDDRIFVPAWDGKRTVKPLEADGSYDVWDEGHVIYTSEDLAYLQGKKITDGKYYLMADVDMGGDDGIAFEPIVSVFYLNGVKKEFIGKDGLGKEHNNTIYNCKVFMESHDGTGAAFIKTVSKSGTVHCNINMVGSDIFNEHDRSIPEPGPYDKDNGAGNALAATFVVRVNSPYTISNVHVSSGKVHAVAKIGGMIGLVSSTIDMCNCSVSDYVIENYEANVRNYYTMQAAVSSYSVYAHEWWYTHGECGGLIGFVRSSDALIESCSVTDTEINCYGQPDKEVIAGVYSSGFTPENPTRRIARGKTLVAGRHVNQFIGDVRTAKTTDKVVIKDYHVSGNTYFGVPAETGSTSDRLDDSYRHHYKTESGPEGDIYHYCNCVGRAYYVGVDIYLDIIIMQIEKHVSDYAGTLIFNAEGEEPVTITEPVGSGNDVSWTGGDFLFVGLG